MAYTKTVWENAPSTNTPINSTNLNHIEQGIYDNSLKADQVGDLTTLTTTSKTTIVGAINEVNGKLTTRTNLWNGSKNTTGDVSLSDAYTNYDLLAVTIGANDYRQCKTEFVWTSTIPLNYEINFSIFQSSSVYSSLSAKFTANTTFNIIKFTTAGWNTTYLVSIDGINL